MQETCDEETRGVVNEDKEEGEQRRGRTLTHGEMGGGGFCGKLKIVEGVRGQPG